jgi:hypothetical protein
LKPQLLFCGLFLNAVAFCWLSAAAGAAVPSSSVIIHIKFNDDLNEKTLQKIVICDRCCDTRRLSVRIPSTKMQYNYT